MGTLTLHQLGEVLRERRGSRGIREVAAEIAISPATLSRVERGHLPDLNTFGLICKWLEIDPAEVLQINPRRENPAAPNQGISANVHFKGGQTSSPALAKALAELIISAQRKLASDPVGTK